MAMRPEPRTVPGAGIADVHRWYRPDHLDAAREAVVATGESGTSVLVHAGGTKLAWGARPSGGRAWSVVDTRDLDRLVHHEPGDMTAVVQAGMRLDHLQRRLAAAGQRLAVDPPNRGGATVGGVYVANDAGPRRFGYGGMRDLVIGTTTVLADGTVSHSGGSVIKNVAGYDLGKLWCGSLGTLGVVVEMIVRLHPLPEATRTLCIPAGAPAATAFVVDLLASPVECTAVEWSSQEELLLVELEGRDRGLDARVDQLAALVHQNGLVAEPVDGDAEVLWQSWRDAHAGLGGTGNGGGTGGSGGVAGNGWITGSSGIMSAPPTGPAHRTVARATTLPDRLAGVAEGLAAAARTADTDAELHSHAGLGLHDAVIRGNDVEAQAATLAGWRKRVGALGGSVVVRDRPAGMDEHVDPWGEVGSEQLLRLSRSVKRTLDPEGRFAPGRFAGGL